MSVKNEDVAKEYAVKQQWEAYVRARDNGHLDYVEVARKCDDYYTGKQWDEAVVSELDAARRPHNTVNLVLSTVNAVLGEYISSREDLSFKPMGGGATQEIATALRSVTHQIQQNNKSRWVEQQVFSDGLIEDRGYFDLRIDFTDSLEGEVREVAIDPKDVLLDPGAKEYDPASWSEVYISRWWTPDQIAAYYGEAVADRLRYIGPNASYGSDSVQFDTATFAQDQTNQIIYGDQFSSADAEARRVRRVRVIERQYYKLKTVYTFVDPATGDTRDAFPTWELDRVQEFGKKFGLAIIKKVKRAVWCCVTADHELLFNDWFLSPTFSIIPYFPYFRRGRPVGLVRNLLSPQDLLNKVSSQELHVINTTANSGWVIQAGSLINMTTDELAQVGAKTGLVLEYSRGFEKPEKIQPNSVPTGLDRISGKAAMYFREISGVSEAMLGIEAAEVSGVALENKQRRGLVQMEIVFDNLAKTRALRAEKYLELVQQFYTETRVVRITERDINGDEVVSEVAVNQPTAEGTIVNNLTLGEYQVVVSSTPTRESAEENTFAKLMQLREAGVLVPDWKILEVSGLPDRQDFVDYAKQMAGALEPTPEEVQRQQLFQEMEMRMLMAQVADLEATVQERSANIQLTLAKAEAEGQKVPAELQKLGAQLRVEMERMRQESADKRAELLARLELMRQKTSSEERQAQWAALTDRLDSASRERLGRMQTSAKLIDTAAKVSAARFKATAGSQSKPKKK